MNTSSVFSTLFVTAHREFLHPVLNTGRVYSSQILRLMNGENTDLMVLTSLSARMHHTRPEQEDLMDSIYQSTS